MAKLPKNQKHPADKAALAPETTPKTSGQQAKTGEFLPSPPSNLALAPDCRRPEDMIFVRREGIEMTHDGSRVLYRDSDISRVIGFSRPRYIRERIREMLDRGDIGSHQVIIVSEDEVQTFYLDSAAAMKLAFRSNVGDAEIIAMRMMRIMGLTQSYEEPSKAMSGERALAAVAQTLARIDRAESAGVKAAYIPVLECYCRMAGLPIPDRTLLLGVPGPDGQLKLPEV